MKELEENIADYLRKYPSIEEDYDCPEMAKEILSLLPDFGSQPNKWGLTMARSCYHVFGDSKEACDKCHGTGFINRVLTNDETGEFLSSIVKDVGGVFVFKGERVIVKRNP